MATEQKDLEVIEFKTQKKINEDRRKILEEEREALRKRVAGIWNQGTRNPHRKNYV